MAIPSPHPVESHSSLFQNASSNCVASNIVCFAQSLLIVLIASFFVPETATILSNIFSFFTSISNCCSPLFPVLFSRVYLKMQKVIHLSQLQKNFQTHSDFHFLPSVAILIDNTALFYILFSLFYCLYCTKRKTTVKHFLFPFLFLSIRLSTVIFCFFFRTISHFAYNNCSPVDAIRINLFTMPRKDVKKRLFLSNSCIDNPG